MNSLIKDGTFAHFLLNKDEYEEVSAPTEGYFGDLVLISKKDSEKEHNFFLKQTFENDIHGNLTYFTRELMFYFTIKQHPCITKFYGYFTNPCAIVQEYVPNGTLQNIWNLSKDKKAPAEWTNTAIAKAIFGITAALQHLHSLGIFHRHLCLSSILLDDKYEIKLTDFCFSKIITDDLTKTAIITNPIYIAPEIIDSVENYSPSIDVYAFGIILYQLLTGKDPYNFTKMTPLQLQQKVIEENLRPQIPSDIDPEIKTVLEACWEGNPENRPEFFDILRFFKNYPKPLLTGVDMNEYQKYVETVLSDTHIEDENRDFFFSPQLTEERVANFNCLLESANETGDAEDLFKVGRLYEVGYGTNIDPGVAYEYYSRAAEKGSARAMYMMSLMLMDGKGVEIDHERSTELMRQSSELGFLKAAIEYAKRVRFGIGLKKPKPKTALGLFKKLAIEPICDKEAMFEYSDIILNPQRKQGEERDDDEDEEVRIERADIDEAVKFLQESCNQRFVPALANYATMLLDGNVIEADYEEGRRILEYLAEQNVPLAINNLGNCYEKGDHGFPQDIKRAVKYYERASKLKLVAAMERYAVHLKNGKYIEPDPEKAAHYFKIAADEGFQISCHNYANYLAEGDAGVQFDRKLAISYYEKAAKGISYYKIGMIYIEGRGNVETDRKKAREYFRKAADLGFKKAQEFLDENEEEEEK